MHITDLEGSKATRANVEKFLLKENPRLVFFNGHGDRNCVAGHNDEIILDKKNICLTKNKIVYSLACDSLESLGALAVKSGTAAYIGYRARFMVVSDPTRTSTPAKDKNALPFRRACHALISSIINGETVGQAIRKTKEEYKHSIRSLGTSEDDPYGDIPLIRFALAWDLEFLDMCGNPVATF